MRIDEEIKTANRIMEGEDVAPTDELQAKFKNIVERYRGKLTGVEVWTPRHGWEPVQIGKYVELVYDPDTGYQMKTLLNSKSFGYAEVEEWQTELGQALLMLTRFRENKIPVKM